MDNHNFYFYGGEILKKMGASWFISYCWYERKDKTHFNWQKVKTYKSRRVRYLESRSYHDFWIKQIMNMNVDLLSKNTIGLRGTEVIKMAKVLFDGILE